MAEECRKSSVAVNSLCVIPLLARFVIISFLADLMTPLKAIVPEVPFPTIHTPGSRNACPYSFKLYVYPLPNQLPPLALASEARQNRSYHICQKCIYEQFALEYVVYDYFTQFCARTSDPEKADYFYLPIVRDIEYRIALLTGKRKPSEIEEVLLEALEKKPANLLPWVKYLSVSTKYWKKNNGADHIIVMPAPVTNLRHQTSQRGFFHYMIHLNPPIFLNVEYSKSFVQEYPICAGRKNIVMPYPNTDPDLFSGRLLGEPIQVQRNKLLYYQGGHHGSCVQIREGLNLLMRDKLLAPQKVGARKREMGFRQAVFCPVPVGDSPSSKRQYDIMHFGCIPVILSDDLLYAYTSAIIPTTEGEERLGGRLFEGNFSIRFPQRIVQHSAEDLVEDKSFGIDLRAYLLPSSQINLFELLVGAVDDARRQNRTIEAPYALAEILKRIPQADISALQAGVHHASVFYRFYAYNTTMREIPTSRNAFPDGGAMAELGRVLQAKWEWGVTNTSNQCQTERQRKHGYRGNYPCEHTPKKDKNKDSGKNKKFRIRRRSRRM